MKGLRINDNTSAEILNLRLTTAKPCCGCGKDHSVVPYAILCDAGHIWFDCRVCLSTNLIVNRVGLTPEQLERLDGKRLVANASGS